MIDQPIAQLDDPDPVHRQNAAIALGDLQVDGRSALPHLLARIRSTSVTPHDRACAAWALGKVGSSEIVAQLLSVLQAAADQPETDELRRCAAEAIEQLTSESDVLLQVARTCLQDRFFKCKLIGLNVIGRVGENGRELIPLVERLVHDEMLEVREEARSVLDLLV